MEVQIGSFNRFLSVRSIHLLPFNAAAAAAVRENRSVLAKKDGPIHFDLDRK